MSSERPLPTDSPCPSDGCNKFVTVRGFCVACYYRHLRRGDLERGGQSRRWKHRVSNVNVEQKTGHCAECGPVKVTHRAGTSAWRCSVDSNHRAKLYKRAYRQHKKDVLLDACQICGSMDKLCWDHDHNTGRFRGTLCGTCNTGIGMFKDDIGLLEKARIYLTATNAHE